MRTLITGGDGFISKSLKKLLRHGDDCTLLNRGSLDLLDSCRVLEYIRDNDIDIIIHGATYDAAPEFSTKDPQMVLENNLRMFFNLARCEPYFNKMIYFGSGAEFNRAHWRPRMNEEYFDSYVPSDPYGYSKYLMTRYALNSDKIYNLRLFGLFGPHDDWRYRFISNACCKAVLDLPITMRHDARFDYLYINDLAQVVDWAIFSQPKHRVYNICSGVVYSYMELARKILNICNKDLEIIMENNESRPEYSGDPSRFRSESPSISFRRMDDSIEDLYNWYNTNQNIINPSLFVY